MNRARAWWSIALVLAASATLLYGLVLPGGYLTWLYTAMVLWAAAAVLWLLSWTGQSWPVRSVLPLVSLVTMVVACSGVSGPALFRLHHAGLEQLAASPSGATYGLYRFSTVWSQDGCVTYVTGDSGMSYFSGLVRCAPGVRPSPRLGDTARDAVFDPLGDDWYAFTVPRSGSRPWGFNPFTVRAPAEA